MNLRPVLQIPSIGDHRSLLRIRQYTHSEVGYEVERKDRRYEDMVPHSYELGVVVHERRKGQHHISGEVVHILLEVSVVHSLGRSNRPWEVVDLETALCML